MDQNTVCDAFIQAKSHVEFNFKKKESDMFTLLPKQNTHPQCNTIDKSSDGEVQCDSDHVQVRWITGIT